MEWSAYGLFWALTKTPLTVFEQPITNTDSQGDHWFSPQNTSDCLWTANHNYRQSGWSLALSRAKNKPVSVETNQSKYWSRDYCKIYMTVLKWMHVWTCYADIVCSSVGTVEDWVKKMALFSDDLKCWGAWDTTCPHKAKDSTPSIAWRREAWKEEVSITRTLEPFERQPWGN